MTTTPRSGATVPADDPTGRADRALAAVLGFTLGDAVGGPNRWRSRAQIASSGGGTSHGDTSGGDTSAPPATSELTDALTSELTDALTSELTDALTSELTDALTRAAAALAGREDATPTPHRPGPSADRAAGPSVHHPDPAHRGQADLLSSGVPLGVRFPAEPLDGLVARVVGASPARRRWRLDLAGVAALAAAVSAGIDGSPNAEMQSLAMAAADGAAANAEYAAGPDLSTRIAWAVGLATRAGGEPSETEEILEVLVGTSPVVQESLPCAFALVSLYTADPWLALTAAARLGGDTRLIAALTGALLGARHGTAAFPPEVLQPWLATEPAGELVRVTAELVALRTRS